MSAVPVVNSDGEPVTKVKSGLTVAQVLKRIRYFGFLEDKDGFACGDDDIVAADSAPYVFKQQQQQKRSCWYLVTAIISRPPEHAGARRRMFQLASQSGLYPQGLDCDTAFECLPPPTNGDSQNRLKFTVVFKSDSDVAHFADNLREYLLENQGMLRLLDNDGTELSMPKVSEIPPFPINLESWVLRTHYGPQINGDEAATRSPVVDVIMGSRSSSDSTWNVTVLSTRDETFQCQRIEDDTAFILVKPESAHIFPSAKCSGEYEWLDDKPYNRLALSRDIRINFDGTGRGLGKRRRTAQKIAIKPIRPRDGYSITQLDNTECYEIPLELVLNDNDIANAVLQKLKKNAQINRNTDERWTIDGADVRIFYPRKRRVELLAEHMDDGSLSLVTAVPGVEDLRDCWSNSQESLLSLEAAEVLEKCLLWNYEQALRTWSTLG